MLGALFIYTNFVLHLTKIDFPRTVSSVVVTEKKYDQSTDRIPKPLSSFGVHSYCTKPYNIQIQDTQYQNKLT